VSRKGLIDYVLLPGIPITGLTTQELRDLLAPKLIQYQIEPNLFVFLTESRTIRFQVQGYVRGPGRFEAEAPVDLKMALMMSGDVLPDGDPQRVKVFRLEGTHRVTLEFETREWYRQDTLIYPPELMDEDIVIVLRIYEPYMVQVAGEVTSPGRFLPDDDENLSTIIDKAGGMKEGADERHVIVLRRVNGRRVELEFDLKDLEEQYESSALPKIYGGDVVIVRKIPGWKTYDFWFSGLQQTMWLITTYYFFRTLIRQEL